MHGPLGESSYTKAISNLAKKIQNKSVHGDSLFEQAEAYFNSAQKNEDRLEGLLQKQLQTKERYEHAHSSKNTALKKEWENATKAYKQEKQRQEKERLDRLNAVVDICIEVLLLAEGSNWEKTQVNSAKLLGTVQLLSHGEGPDLAKTSQKLKPTYKAIVALRLLDKLLADNEISTKYINKRYDPQTRYNNPKGKLTEFQRDVLIPMIMASIFQDVGILHKDAQEILKGKSGNADEFRVLAKEDRLALLKINHSRTLEYITAGLGMQSYVGNSKEERAMFVASEKLRIRFIRTLLTSALNPGTNIGNLIKVPQIYTSFVLSSKSDFSFMNLPKASIGLRKSAERGSISPIAVEALIAILGHFPQGYGVTFTPKEQHNVYSEQYEYAIVIGLNPSDPFVPICRVATRNLTFISNGQIVEVGVDQNLYFPDAKKRVEKINPERLREILRQLSSNFVERLALELVPSFWNPYVYFSYQKLQNLWKKT